MADELQGGLNAVTQLAEVPNEETPIVKEPTKEDLFKGSSEERLKQQRIIYDAHLQDMIDSFKGRTSNLGYDPKLLALARGLLTPGKTGNFFESLGTAFGNYDEAAQEEQKLRLQDAKARMDLMKSGQELSEKQIIAQLAPKLFKVDEKGQFTGEIDPIVAQKMVSLTGDINIIQKAIEMSKPQIGELAPGASLYDKRKGQIILTAPTVPKESTPTELKKTLDELSVIEENLAKDPSNKKLQQAQKVYKDKLEKFDQLEFPDEVLDMLARQALSGDTSVFVNVGRGTQGPNNLVRLRTRMSEIMKASGVSPEEIAARNAEFFGFKAGQRSLGTRGANIELASQEFLNIVPLAKQASEKVGRSKFLPFGKVEVMFNEQVNDPDLAEFAAYNNGIINTYARAISPTGVPTVSDKMHARKIITEAKDQKAYNAAINALEKEIAAAKRSPTEVRESMRKDFVKSETIPPKSQDKSTSGKAYLNNREIVVRGGKWVYADTGQEAK